MRIRSIGNIIVFILLLFEKSTTSNCEILIQPTGGLFMSSVFYRFEHSSPAVRGRKNCNSRTKKFECNLSATDSRAGSVKANKRHNPITAGTVERISAIFVELLFSKRRSIKTTICYRPDA